ncbi:olfactory receptor 5AL1 [Rhinolophus sinicus]|uniref:olfactory receptor 5AL1 n=1 Tax=Rhinolophus sinicus TaxID=89399 RepID=UPI003D7BDE22
MAKGNHSAFTEFILLGLTDNPELQTILFCVFLLIYLVTALGNLGLIVLIQISPQLHTPMYFFLCHLAFVDFYGTSTVTPNTLVNSLRKIKSMSFYACATQVCCFITFSVWELLMLSVMAYDRYVAICNPLLYVVLMPRRLCVQMVTSSYIYGFSVGLIQAMATFHMSFCDSNVVNQFYCDDVPLIALACSDTHVKELMLLVIAGFNVFCSLIIVLISYGFIVFAILRIHSAVGRQKAFSTCASHLFSISLYYGTLSFMYLQPKSSHSLDKDKFASVFYAVVIPMVNPLIYSLRNQEVKNALKKIIEKGEESLTLKIVFLTNILLCNFRIEGKMLVKS